MWYYKDTMLKEIVGNGLLKYIFVFFVVLFLFAGCNDTSTNNEEKQTNQSSQTPIKITDSYIATLIKDEEPVEIGNDFEIKKPDESKRVYYWTEGVTTEVPIEVYHVWKKNGKEMVRFRIPINDYHFKEWTSIEISAEDEGEWEVCTEYGNDSIDSKTFKVVSSIKSIYEEQEPEKIIPLEISIVDKAFTQNIEGREPVERLDVFGNKPGKIYFWTKVKANRKTYIYHIWYHKRKNEKKWKKYQEQKLDIGMSSTGWRTWSYITIRESSGYDYTGDWKAVIKNEKGEILDIATFEIINTNQTDNDNKE